MVRAWTWDGVADPFEGFIRDARQEAGHLRVGLSHWTGRGGWKFWVYREGELVEVLAGDTVVLEDDGTITITRKETS